MPKRCSVIFGPPGTGKTTHLLNLVHKELAHGVSPDQIAYVAFTRKAANEAKARAGHMFNLQSNDLPWFRTLHSLAYAILGLTKTSMMTRSHYRTMYSGLRLGIPDKVLAVGHTIDEDVESPLVAMGGVCDGVYSFARQTLTSPDYAWRNVGASLIGKISHTQFTQFVKGLEHYKYDNALLDYTDLLEMFVKEGWRCPVEVAFIDEAQDLTPLQWKMVDCAFAGVKRVYIAGDDDQAIYSWAGANAERLLQADGDRTVLGKSYRLPRQIHSLALDISSRIRVREPKEWTHNGEEGTIGSFNMRKPEDMSEGTWLLTARDGFLLKYYVEMCKEAGYIFTKHGKLSVNPDHYSAIVAWERLRKGGHVKGSEALQVYDLMGANIGFKWGARKLLEDVQDNDVNMVALQDRYGLLTDLPWFSALTAIKKEDLNYYRKVLERGEKLTALPRINISTIHGSKGGEADTVVIRTDTATTSYKQAIKMPCDEHRVFYVGVTRTKSRLLMVPPATPTHYKLNTRGLM